MTKPGFDSRYRLSMYGWDDLPSAARDLRQRVFVDEQKVPPELEWDETDKLAEHFLVHNADEIAVGVARLYPDGTGGGRIGRMAVARSERGTGLGLWLLRAVMAQGKKTYAHLILSAQEQAIPFYQRAGFIVCSDTYQDAGIPHRTMRCSAPSLVLNQDSETDTPLHLGQDTTTWQLSSHVDWNAALDALTSQARRRLWLFEPTLDSGRYDREHLRDSLSELARRSRNSEVRLLILDDRPLVERRHRLVELMRRLPSHIHLRLINSDYSPPAASFALIDDTGVAYRHQSAEPSGFANFNSPGRARQLAEQFQRMWDLGQESIELRDMLL